MKLQLMIMARVDLLLGDLVRANVVLLLGALHVYLPAISPLPASHSHVAWGQIIREKTRQTLSMLMTMLRTVGGNAHSAKVCEMCLPNEISMGRFPCPVPIVLGFSCGPHTLVALSVRAIDVTCDACRYVCSCGARTSPKF